MLNERHRKARALFGLSDIALTALSFWAAYQVRLRLPLENNFALDFSTGGWVLSFSALSWLLIGLWLQVYDRLDSGAPRVILRETFRQCAYGSISLIVFEFTLRLDLSRPFLALLTVFSWIFLCLFRLTAGSLIGVVRREFGGPHFIMIVGLGPARGNWANNWSARRNTESACSDFCPRSRSGIDAHSDHTRRGLFCLSRFRSPADSAPAGDRRDRFRGRQQPAGRARRRLPALRREGVRTRVAVDFFPHINSKVTSINWARPRC
jgi:hypothetical protein